MSNITPPAFGTFPLGESDAIDVAVHSGANGQIAGNAQPWLVLRFISDGTVWAAGAPFDINFAGTTGTTYLLINDTVGIGTFKARAASASSIQLQPTERALVTMCVDPATNTMEFRKVSSVINSSANQTQRARGVVTVALAAYTAAAGTITANANGAIGAVMDGLTPAAGDMVFLPEGIAAAAKDAGPYQVISAGAGGAPFVLTRPSWYAFGSVIPQGFDIRIGPEGTVSSYAGSLWKSFVLTATKVVDTDAPLFWPQSFQKIITLTNGTVTVGSNDFLALRSTTKSSVQLTRDTPGAATANTVEYASAVAGRTAGAIGTGAIVVQATVAAGTINAADTLTTLLLQVTNF